MAHNNSVWVKLVIDGDDSKVPTVFATDLTPHMIHVDHLTKAIAEEADQRFDEKIHSLAVYPLKTPVPVPEDATPLRPDLLLSDLFTNETAFDNPLIVTAKSRKPQQQQEVPEHYRPALEFARQQLEAKTVAVSMSKASCSFARQLLAAMGIEIMLDSPNLEEGTRTNPESFKWTVKTNQNMEVGLSEHQQTPNVMEWLVKHFLPGEDTEWGIKVVTGYPLPELYVEGKRSMGKGDLAIGKKKDFEFPIDTPYGHVFGLIEIKQETSLIKSGQCMLELVALSTISRVGRCCALMATDCCSKWELYWFSDNDTILRRQYKHSRKCWEDFRALLDVAEKMFLLRRSKRKRSVPPRLKSTLSDHDEQADDDNNDEQNLVGFDGIDDDSKQAAVNRHAQLNQMANYLEQLYGERPVIPSWALAEHNCPEYYL